MIFRSRHFLAAFALATGAHAEPLAELAAFSAFKNVNLEKLAAGAPMAARGPAMSFPRGLAVESCYVVRRPLARTVELHREWSPLRHSDLKVWLHGDLPARPGAGDFQKLRGAPSNGAVKAFVAATQKLGAGASELQLSKAEAGGFAGAPGEGGGSMPAKVADFWSGVLAQRAQAFASGGLARQPAYENGGEAIRVADDVSRLMKEAPKVRAQFSTLIDGALGHAAKGALYWELVGVEDDAAVNLGASFARPGANTWQGLDVQFYASGGYCALLTLRQMWPVTVGGQEATLVWQGSLISSAKLATLHGVERMGSSTAMMRETQKFIARFLGDIAKAP